MHSAFRPPLINDRRDKSPSLPNWSLYRVVPPGFAAVTTAESAVSRQCCKSLVWKPFNQGEIRKPVCTCGPQGSILSPFFFLVYINDLPEQVKSRIRIFADDTAMYLTLSSHIEGQILQNDLLSIEKWEKCDIWFLIPPTARSFMLPALNPHWDQELVLSS